MPEAAFFSGMQALPNEICSEVVFPADATHIGRILSFCRFRAARVQDAAVVEVLSWHGTYAPELFIIHGFQRRSLEENVDFGSAQEAQNSTVHELQGLLHHHSQKQEREGLTFVLLPGAYQTFSRERRNILLRRS